MHELLGYQLAQTTIVANSHFVSEVGKPYTLRPIEFTILQLIHENNDVSPTRLARALAVTTPGMTAWLDKLESRQLLARQRSAQDGRAQHLCLTPAGEALVVKAMSTLRQADLQLMAHLSHGERTILLELLRKIGRSRATKD